MCTAGPIPDIAMPEMDGYELVRRIRTQMPAPQPIVVALTGYGQRSDWERALEAGFDDHLAKPVSIGKLRALLGRFPTGQFPPGTRRR